MELRPKFQELREARMYSEAAVKRMLFTFAKNTGCDWPDEELRQVIEEAFDFD